MPTDQQREALERIDALDRRKGHLSGIVAEMGGDCPRGACFFYSRGGWANSKSVQTRPRSWIRHREPAEADMRRRRAEKIERALNWIGLGIAGGILLFEVAVAVLQGV